MTPETDDSDQGAVHLAFRAFCEQGSAHALEGLLRAHADRAYAQAWHLLGHEGDAQDALQEAFLQLVRKRSQYDGSVPFRSILFHLVYRSAQMVRRARRRRRNLEGGPMPSTLAVQEPAPDDPRQELVRRALGTLPERDREALHLHYIAGFSREEVARTLGLTIGALDTRLHRGRERLRLLMERQGAGASMAAGLPLFLHPIPRMAPSGVLSGIRELSERVAANAPLPATHLPLPLLTKVVISMQTHPLATLLTIALLICGSVYVIEAADAPLQSKAVVGSFPIRFRLDRPSTVTMVIEDASGRRVRNLAADIRLPPGDHVLTWDGFDDGVDTAAGRLRQRAAPGTYRARGLTHDGLDLIYEFSVYHGGGSSPWFTKDGTGAWMGDHAPPSAVLLLPKGVSPVGGGQAQLFLGSGVGEAGHPLIWVDTDGKKLGGGLKVWGWYGASVLARDTGAKAVADYYAYSLFTTRDNDQTKGDLHLVGFDARNGFVELSAHAVHQDIRQPGNAVSLAVRDGIAVMSYQGDNVLVLVDVASKRSLGTITLPSPRGLAFASDGRLLVASGTQVKSFTLDATAMKLGDERVVIASGLEDPAQILIDPTGRMLVTDRGASHQLKVFSPDGRLQRTIGKAGGLQLGAYDEQRMQNPNQVAIDDRGRYWVAEEDVLPKRVSIWTADGTLVKAIYGGPGYGAGGSIDPQDRTRVYYQHFTGAMEFALDWTAGTSRPVAVYHRRDRDPLGNAGNTSPQQPIRLGGRLYLTNSEVNFIYKQESTVGLWLMGDDHIARPVMVAGTVRLGHSAGWSELHKPAYSDRLAGLDTPWTLFVWSDANHDGEVQPDEVQFRQAKPWERQWGPDRAALANDLSIMSDIGLMAKPVRIDERGIPFYDLAKAEEVGRIEGELMRAADGSLLGSLSGLKNGIKIWSYPSRGGETPPSIPGEVVAPNRILGQPITPGRSEAGQIFAINGYKGNIFLFTTDGLFITELGGDIRVKPLWRMPLKRGEMLPPVSFEDEHFWPTLNRAADGTCYLVAGKEHSSILRLEGLQTIRRRDYAQLALTAQQLAPLSTSYLIPLRPHGRGTMRVTLAGAAPVVDGRLDEWRDADWARIDNRADAAVMVAGDRLHVAWRTGDPGALANAGGDPRFLFKKGGAVDLMIGTDPTADRDRREPAPGDLRLMATMVRGRPVGVLYRAVVPGADGSKRTVFDSPVGRVEFADVEDISDRIVLAQHDGDIELSVPLALLGLKPEPQQEILADVGLLRGDGVQTTQRSYWNNQGATIVSDVPSEARLEPANWGEWQFIESMHH